MTNITALPFEGMVYESRDGIHLVDLEAILEHLYGDYANWPDYMEQLKPALAWLESQIGPFKYTYYGACKEDFYARDGWDRAKREGSTILFMENLS